MAAEKILIVDDEPEAMENCRRILSRERYQCVVEADAERALATIERERPQIVLTDIRMPGLDGIALLKAAKRIDPSIKVILLTAYASVQTAVASMRHGAFDYLTKPFTGKMLCRVIRRALGDTAGEPDRAGPAEPSSAKLSREDRLSIEPALAGDSVVMQALRSVVERVADTEAAVLVTGERGTGKERIARVLHAGSARRSGQFVAVECVASSDVLVERELFGASRSESSGMATGAASLILSADRGTLFLHDVGGLSLRLQAKLLRVLKERRMRHATGALYSTVDARVVAASSQDLQRACEAGEFREDLYQFLNVVPVTVPSLRTRREDISLLVRLLMEPLVRHKYRRMPASFGCTSEALDRLCRYEWPGNVRELQQVVERAVVLAESPLLDVADLPETLQ